jgi:lipoprotein-anchoring transpeptidase ErfK/SrfK
MKLVALARVMVVLLLVACAPAATQAGTRRFDAQFRAAATDTAAIVPLILEGSRHLHAVGLEQERALADRLEPFCARAFFSAEELPASERLGLSEHRVAKNEIPGRIAQRYRITPELLARLNRDYDERRLQIGQELRVLDLAAGELWVEVHKSSFRLALWHMLRDEEGREVPLLLACLPVGLGASDSPTPSGETTVEKRVRDPEWTDPVSGRVFAPKDPGNVLGGYWIALAPEGIGKQGIGFHGYTGAAPADWIEKPASNGCVRLLQADIDRLFHTALEGTRVVLR